MDDWVYVRVWITVLFPLLVRKLCQKSYLDSVFFITVLLWHKLNLSHLSEGGRFRWSGRQNLMQTLMSSAYPKKTNKIKNLFILIDWINPLLDTIWCHNKRQCDQIALVLHSIFSSECSGFSHGARCPYLILNVCFVKHYNSLHEKLPTALSSLLTHTLHLLGEEKKREVYIKREVGKE